MHRNSNDRAKPGRLARLRLVLESIAFLIRNANYFRALRRLEQARATLVRANIELGKLSYRDALYTQRVGEFDQAAISLAQGKWYVAAAMESRAAGDWAKGFRTIRRSQELGQRVYDSLRSGASEAIPHHKATLSSSGTEISFADGVPLVPEVNPLVVLQGSDYEMGYQYAQQLVHVFGPWILQRKAGGFKEERRDVIRRWEEQIRLYAPEILGLCEGWAAGATHAGVPMSYEDVLVLWTGDLPPAANYLGRGEGMVRLAPPLCSGVAAWGRATVDGRLVTGSSGDHDPTFMVTIIAFPETGNSFVVSPFSATGDVPVVGPVYMMGHPGMNSKGLAYVHHGGELRMVEPRSHWGYGIRRGTSIFHVLRFASSAREALDMELSYPVGDVGRAMGSVGGFYADGSYGYVLESRRDPVALREAGLLGETDFLYANNSPLHPDSGKAEWMQSNRENWLWDAHGGWYPAELVVPELFPRRRGRGTTDRTGSLLGHMYHNSRGRNLHAHDMLQRALGHIDLEYMKMMYRRSGTLPTGAWEEIAAAYKATGRWGEVSTAHAGNAVVAVMKPDAGMYALCVSTAARGVTPNVPNPSGGPICGETNAFWELKLASAPAGVAAYAAQRARECIDRAEAELAGLRRTDPAYQPLAALLGLARRELASGEGHESAAGNSRGNEAVYNWARATRAHSRAQVRARQVCNALVPPPSRPEDLGL
jgi:hypothetical protein